MEEADGISDELKDVTTVVKNRKFKNKHQTTSESSDLESDGGKLSEESSEPSEEVLEEERDGNENESLNNHHENDSGESDPVEQDVKVCDICGDAGREDLLALCCRCPNGAEHSYCMKVGSLKLPVGDWFCEECKLEEESKNRNTNRQEYPIPGEPLHHTTPVMIAHMDRQEDRISMIRDILLGKETVKDQVTALEDQLLRAYGRIQELTQEQEDNAKKMVVLEHRVTHLECSFGQYQACMEALISGNHNLL